MANDEKPAGIDEIRALPKHIRTGLRWFLMAAAAELTASIPDPELAQEELRIFMKALEMLGLVE